MVAQLQPPGPTVLKLKRTFLGSAPINTLYHPSPSHLQKFLLLWVLSKICNPISAKSNRNLLLEGCCCDKHLGQYIDLRSSNTSKKSKKDSKVIRGWTAQFSGRRAERYWLCSRWYKGSLDWSIRGKRFAETCCKNIWSHPAISGYKAPFNYFKWCKVTSAQPRNIFRTRPATFL